MFLGLEKTRNTRKWLKRIFFNFKFLGIYEKKQEICLQEYSPTLNLYGSYPFCECNANPHRFVSLDEPSLPFASVVRNAPILVLLGCRNHH